MVRDPAHKSALEHVVLAAFTTDPPCRRKANRPPGDEARKEAAKLLSGFEDDEVVVSLGRLSEHRRRHGDTSDRGAGMSEDSVYQAAPGIARLLAPGRCS